MTILKLGWLNYYKLTEKINNPMIKGLNPAAGIRREEMVKRRHRYRTFVYLVATKITEVKSFVVETLGHKPCVHGCE